MDRFVRVRPSLDYLKMIMRTFDGYSVDNLMSLDSDKQEYKKRGIAFEKMCMALLESMGCRCDSTPNSDDDGIDIICYAQNRVINIQCKNYSGSVGKEAVQEVISGSFAHPCHMAAVFTNSSFTTSAQEFAEKINRTPGDAHVVLVDGYDLRHFSMRLFGLVDTVEFLTVSAANVKDSVPLGTAVEMITGYEVNDEHMVSFSVTPDIVLKLIQEKKLQKSNNILEPYITKASIIAYNKRLFQMMSHTSQSLEADLGYRLNTNTFYTDRSAIAGFDVNSYDLATDESYSVRRCRKVSIENACLLLDGYVSLFGVQYRSVTSKNVVDLIKRGYLEIVETDKSKIYYASIYRYNSLLKNKGLQPVRFDEGFYQEDKIVYDRISQRQFDMELWLGLHWGIRTVYDKLVSYLRDNETVYSLIDSKKLDYSVSLGYEGISRKSVNDYIQLRCSQ